MRLRCTEGHIGPAWRTRRWGHPLPRAACRAEIPIPCPVFRSTGIRSEPTHFALALNHENLEIDKVITENERFATIEKSFGAPSRIARESDPRR